MPDLKKIHIFSALSESELKELAPYLHLEKKKKKEAIFSEGDPPDWLYIVAKGRVKITKLSQEGKEIILEIINPNDFFGGVAVIRNFNYPANAVAMEDTELLKISRQDLMKILDKYPPIMQAVFGSLGGRLKESHESLRSIALEKVTSRVASLLLKLAEKSGKKTPEGILVELKLTKQEIAEIVGTTVETSIRTMSRLKKQGLIEERGGEVLIKDMERLEEMKG
jgi:CRP-like cAMP-binding protein